jgi:predicted acylesterase/phospholipase RssA
MEENTAIKHLVITGGGIAGITAYSILRESHNSGIWNIENIESIYGTSAGAIIGVFIALKYEWAEIDNYIIKRPWENVFKFDVGAVLRSFDSKGILGNGIKWNFTKFLIGRDGKVLNRFAPTTKPEDLEDEIAKVL